jgi:hypothetical protein
MQALVQCWQKWSRTSIHQAWGLAPLNTGWILCKLTRPIRHLAKVHTLVVLPAPADAAASDTSWLSQCLGQHAQAGGRSRHRLNMALAEAWVKQGVIDFSADRPASDWPYEVQLEAAQTLQLEPSEVSFDFEPIAFAEGVTQRVHWVGCAQAQLRALKNCAHAAGWRLASVESERQAAQRGARALRGGVASLLTQAPQDWQFWLASSGEQVHATKTGHPPEPKDSEATIEAALTQVMSTPSGGRLVAAGLALRAWQ